jgi:cytochrome P450
MHTLAELNLAHLPLGDPAFDAEPHRYFRAARTQHPWLAKSDIGVLVYEYTAIRELLGQDDLLRPAYDGVVDQLGAGGTPWGRFTEEQMISLPTESHRRLRGAFITKFTPRFASTLRPMMRATIRRLLDEWAPKGAFDFEEFASYYPISVMFTMVGAPLEEVAGIRSSLETLGLAFSMERRHMPAINEAFDRLEALVHRVIADRRRDPGSGSADDLLHLLIQTSDQGGISDRQLADLIIFFFIAGYDTSKNVLTFTMNMLLQHPQIYQRCATDYEYCKKVQEEGLRYFNPSSVPRYTNRELLFRDVLIPKDTMLWFNLSVCGRDENAFSEPDRFDPDRPTLPGRRHIAFSLGKHTCLGQYIARAQIEEALHIIPQRLEKPSLAGDYGWRPFAGAWGMKGLPIVFTPSLVEPM